MRAILLAALCLLPHAGAMADLTEEETLRDLDSVALIVEALNEDAEKIHLSRENLKEDAEKKLEAAGLRILSGEERLAHERRPYLYINCNLLYVESIRLASFSIDVEVHQRVRLVNGEMAQGLTWAKSYQGIQSQTKAAAKIREVIGSYVDEFIAAAKTDRTKDAAAVFGRYQVPRPKERSREDTLRDG